MDIQLKQEDLVFRDEVREFLKQELNDSLLQAAVGGHVDKDTMIHWQQVLYRKG